MKQKLVEAIQACPKPESRRRHWAAVLADRQTELAFNTKRAEKSDKDDRSEQASIRAERHACLVDIAYCERELARLS